MKEFELIALLTRGLAGNASVIRGPGDDCGVLDVGAPDTFLLFKTDAVVEGVHFLPDTDRRKVGHKALARCLSDVAAMAGQPFAALITLGLPLGFVPSEIEAVYAGLNELARRYAVAIAGGETTFSPGGLFISIAVIGSIPKSSVITRGGARAGDAIFVTGQLGGSGPNGRHLDFEPRLREAQWLAEHFPVHSMIDLSDGLASDLRHVLDRSGVGAEILSSAIPISRSARLQSRQESSAKPPLLAALTDGEDFELLFTLESRHAVPLLDAWKQRWPEVPLACVGKITAGPGLKIRDRQGLREFGLKGYEHFGGGSPAA